MWVFVLPWAIQNLHCYRMCGCLCYLGQYRTYIVIECVGVCVTLGNTELTCVIECVGVCVTLGNTELTLL